MKANKVQTNHEMFLSESIENPSFFTLDGDGELSGPMTEQAADVVLSQPEHTFTCDTAAAEQRVLAYLGNAKAA